VYVIRDVRCSLLRRFDMASAKKVTKKKPAKKAATKKKK